MASQSVTTASEGSIHERLEHVALYRWWRRSVVGRVDHEAVMARIITHILTDRGSCFTPDDFERTCAKIKISHRKTKPYTPQTSGMVERFNGRIASEVNRAYNRRRQRVLQGCSPRQKVEERIAQAPALANPLYKPRAADELMAKVDDVLYYANDVSQPDS